MSQDVMTTRDNKSVFSAQLILIQLAVQRPQTDAKLFGDHLLALQGVAVLGQQGFDLILFPGRSGGLAGELLGRTGEILRQSVGGEFLFLTQVGAVFNGVLQFAHIARPGVFRQQLFSLGREGLKGSFHALLEALQIVLGDGQDVALSFPQGRDGQVNDADAVVEVLPELALLDQFF